MPTNAQAVESKLHSRPTQLQVIVEPPGPPANLLGFLFFLMAEMRELATMIVGRVLVSTALSVTYYR